MFTGAVEKILGEFGSLSVLIHNAGRSQRARWERTHIQAVLGIRHILVRIQIRQLWLMDPDPDPINFFLLNYPQAHYLQC